MKVGLNLVYLVEDSGGSGTIARRLLPKLLEEPGIELTAWVGSTAPSWLAREPWSADVRWVRIPTPGVGAPWHMWHELVGIGIDARRRGLDLVHGMAYLAPLAHPGVASVVTILDVTWKHYAQATEPRFRITMSVLTPLMARVSDRIIAISEAARDDIAATLGLDPAKFDVTPLGIEPAPQRLGRLERETVAARLGLSSEPIVLCLAAKRAHKNIDGVIRAFALLPEPRPQLALPGSPNAYEQELRSLVAELHLEQSVRFMGWLSDEDLLDLFDIADCFVLASFFEGFGLPVLEAMSHGVPVACSAIGVLEEVAGDGALLFDPHSPASIAAAVGRILGDRELARSLVRRGHERCELFTWERTARATLASYRRALGQG